MAFDASSGSGVRSSVNITPLIDVVLVLLIIFMVMTPTTMKHLKPQIARESTEAAPAGPQPVTVEMTATGYKVNGEDTQWSQLYDRVKARLDQSRQGAVFFKIADERRLRRGGAPVRPVQGRGRTGPGPAAGNARITRSGTARRRLLGVTSVAVPASGLVDRLKAHLAESSSDARVFAVGYLLLLPLYLAPLYVTAPLFPGLDFPFHLAMGDMLAKTGRPDSPYTSFYDGGLALAPYAAHYLALWLMSKAMSLLTAHRSSPGSTWRGCRWPCRRC